jgi:hypothetical protein
VSDLGDLDRHRKPHAIDCAHAALRAKYGWQVWLADVLSRITGRVHHRAWIEIRP